MGASLQVRVGHLQTLGTVDRGSPRLQKDHRKSVPRRRHPQLILHVLYGVSGRHGKDLCTTGMK